MTEPRDHLTNPDHWMRVVLVLVYGVIFWLSLWVLGLVVLLNLVVLLVTGERNEALSHFGRSLAAYQQQLVAYATLNTSAKPFPFGQPLPTPEPASDVAVEAPPEAPPAQSKGPEPASNAEAPPEAQPVPKKKTTRKKTKKKTSRKKKTTGRVNTPAKDEGAGDGGDT
ncbi:MAG: DUF4389 domain-containing protein [Pseudomonadota bacterium]